MPFALAVALSAALLGAVGPASADDAPVAPAEPAGQGQPAEPAVPPVDPGPAAPDAVVPPPAYGVPAPQPDGRPDTGSGKSDGRPGTAGASDGRPQGPSAAGGGARPGERPPAPGEDTGTSAYTDAAPPVDPNFVDNYTRLWKKVQRGKLKVRNLSEDLAAAGTVLSSTNSDLALALRVRNRASFQLSDAGAQFELAVRDMYVTGSTDVGVILGVLGSKPDDLLRTIDSLVYLRSATGMEQVDYEFAQRAALVADSAASSTMMKVDEDRNRLDIIRKTLAKTKKQLKKDQKELQRLIAAAAPQTVVGGNGCPKAVLEGTVPEGVKVKQLCNLAVRTAASPQAAFAIKWALVRLGAPYACEGIGRLDPWRYDCSSYVSRAYAEGAGLKTAGDGWAPSTRNMVPWDGAALDPHYAVIPPKKIRPGDLVLYDTCPAGESCPYRHVVMYLGPAEPGGVPLMAHTNACGDVAHVEAFTGTDVANFLGVRRVIPALGEKIIARKGAFESPAEVAKKKAKTSKTGRPRTS